MALPGLALRRLTPLLLALALGCSAAADPLERGALYLEDTSFRRATLEESLVVDNNSYAELRLAEYATEGGWDDLPEWNPPVRPVTLDDVGRYVVDPDAPSDPSTLAPVLGAELPWTEAALLELGRRAFESYPVQLTATIGAGIEDMASIDRYGFSVDDREHINGLVRVRLTDTIEQFGVTCATCHSRVDGGVRVHGPAAHRFEWGPLAHREGLRAGAPEESIAHFLEWGGGRVDVTPDGVDNPAAMIDLRAVSHQTYLHWAGTLRNELIALAIRLETLMITSMGQTVRPPREVAFALALYVYSLGDAGRPGDAERDPDGAAAFSRHCGSCHGADGTTPETRVRIADVGTDPAVGESSRGTGFYRVPSLWGVGDRGQLLHDGSVGSLEELLDPMRLLTVPGHEYGLRADAAERGRIVEFARTIGAE